MCSPFTQYRENKPSDSDSDSEGPPRIFIPIRAPTNPPSGRTMDSDQLKAVIQTAVNRALAEAAGEARRREEEMRQVIQQLATQVAAVQIAPTQAAAPIIKVYQPIDITGNVECSEPLDAVKCLPEFTGAQETYVSWRQAAVAAYYIFRNYVNSSRHYQAVVIIRSKIRGPADAVLSSFGTVLNFDAIIDRLDFTYSDKRAIHVIEQEMGTLRQGSLTLLQYYDEVEKKLTLLTNKATMSYETAAAKILCDKFRDDALRIFISGLKRSLSDVLFSAKPKDMPTALALAQEVESNHERYTFATSFAKSLEDRDRKQYPMAQERQQTPYQAHSQVSGGKNPHFIKQVKAQVHSAPHNDRRRENTSEPMEVDPSMSRLRQPTQAQAYQNGKPAHSGRSHPHKRQRVNHIAQTIGQAEGTYATTASSAAAKVDDDTISEYDLEVINFLGENPCCPSSDEE